MGTQTDYATGKQERIWLLMLAAAQGAMLTLLHEMVKHLEHPAASLHWLWPLYTLAILLPLSAQLLAAFRRQTEFLRLLGLAGLALAAMAGYGGWRVFVEGRDYSYWSGDAFAFGMIVAACWMLLLPFAQQRLRSDRWKTAYPDYFSGFFDNAARLAGAAAFAGAFWLLLLLAAGLFDVLGVKFVGKQIAEPYFIYAATALCAYAIHLRVQQYGWSADRVWAALAVAVTGFFAAGYAMAAWRRSGAWMADAATVNIAGLPATAALLLATLTPLLDAERIATASQVDRLLSGTAEPQRFDFAYLRFRSGRAGNDALLRGLFRDTARAICNPRRTPFVSLG